MWLRGGRVAGGLLLGRPALLGIVWDGAVLLRGGDEADRWPGVCRNRVWWCGGVSGGVVAWRCQVTVGVGVCGWRRCGIRCVGASRGVTLWVILW